MTSPQRRQEDAVLAGNSLQQTSQIGAEESCGRGEPQSEQEAGSNTQLKLSKGLRSTRTTARQRVVADSWEWFVRMLESLWKTHLARRAKKYKPAHCAKYNAS